MPGGDDTSSELSCSDGSDDEEDLIDDELIAGTPSMVPAHSGEGDHHHLGAFKDGSAYYSGTTQQDGPAHLSGTSHQYGSAHYSGSSHQDGSAHHSGTSQDGSAGYSGTSDQDGSTQYSGTSHQEESAHCGEASHQDESEHPQLYFQDEEGDWVKLEDSSVITNPAPDQTEHTPEMEIPSTVTDFVKLFFTDELMNLIVAETNRYASQFLHKKELSNHSRAQGWKPLTTQVSVNKYKYHKVALSVVAALVLISF